MLFFAILMENTGQKEVALLHWMMMMAAARVFHAVMTRHDHYCQEAYTLYTKKGGARGGDRGVAWVWVLVLPIFFRNIPYPHRAEAGITSPKLMLFFKTSLASYLLPLAYVCFGF